MKTQGIKCMVVDDIPAATRLLAEYINEVYGLELAGCYTSAVKAWETIQKTPPELLFLDIDMPDLPGMDMAQKIKENLYPTLIIFTTASRNHALQAFHVRAIGYLLKPIEKAAFNEAVQRAINMLRKKPGNQDAQLSLMLKTDRQVMQKVVISGILYLESDKGYITVHSQSGRLTTFSTLMEMETRLLGFRFIRVHKSFLVAEQYIDKVIEDEIILTTGTSIPIGRSYKDAFLQYFL